MSNLDPIGKFSEQDYLQFLSELKSEDQELDSSVKTLEHQLDELLSSVGSIVPALNPDAPTNLDANQLKEIEDFAKSEIEAEDVIDDIADIDEDIEQAGIVKSSYEEYVEKAETTKAFLLANAKKARAVKKEKKQKERLLKIEIQRRAFAQNQLNLGQLIPIPQMQMLVRLLTQRYEDLVKKYDQYINTRFTLALRKHIPYQLRVYRKAYPQAFKENPGFMYTASKEYGGGYNYWVTPDLPYYIPQFTEIECVRKTHAEWLPSIDSYIARRFKAKEKLDYYEMRYASALAKLIPDNTYFNLLKHHPFWFILLYEKITGYSLGVADKVAELQPAFKNKMRLTGSIC